MQVSVNTNKRNLKVSSTVGFEIKFFENIANVMYKFQEVRVKTFKFL